MTSCGGILGILRFSALYVSIRHAGTIENDERNLQSNEIGPTSALLLGILRMLRIVSLGSGLCIRFQVWGSSNAASAGSVLNR